MYAANALFKDVSTDVDVVQETYGIPSLDVDCSRTGELAHEALSRGDAADKATGSHPLHHILGVPRNQMAVVDRVYLAIHELHSSQRLSTRIRQVNSRLS